MTNLGTGTAIDVINKRYDYAASEYWGLSLGSFYYRAFSGTEKNAIDPQRCPLTFSEFTLKEFERDKEGNWIDDILDGNDHSIDAVRYAMLDDMLRG